MDDIKLYASKKNHILSLLTITENFSNDIDMSFGIDKCKTQSICRGRYENLEYTGCRIGLRDRILHVKIKSFNYSLP
jgi:hypothetical protein